MKRVVPEQPHEKAERHREWTWCRRKNGFSDNPLWRVVAAQLDMPLYQVVAFVNRLEELANAGEPRGSIAEFRPGEFGAALGMSAADADRIYAALEGPDVRWIDGEHLTGFYKRNPDREDPTNALRQQRYRDRRECQKHLRRLAQQQRITEAARRSIEDGLKDLPDDALDALLKRLRMGDIEGLRVGAAPACPPPPQILRNASNERYERYVTPRADHTTSGADVDKSAEKPPPVDNGAIAGTSEGTSGLSAPAFSTVVADATNASQNPDAVVADETASALRWLETEGVRIVCERMVVLPARAAVLIERWRRDIEDPHVLVDAVLGAEHADLRAGRFHVSVTDAIARHRRAVEQGLSLPLKPVPVGAAVPIPRTTPPPREAATDEARPPGLRQLAG